MQKRLLIVSSMALGSALLFGKGMQDAAAQEKQMASLSPQSGWSVSRIDGNESTADSYCALSRKYEQGMVLTLGRNAAEEYSLAIDFQSIKLNTDKAYSLTLQPGPGQIRAYEMMPASQQAMVVRLGYDDSFFSALQTSGVLKAELDGSNYQFNVTDFTSGKKDLDNCLSDIKGKPTTKVAKRFSAEKIDDAPPMVAKKTEPVKKIVEAPAKKIEMVKADTKIEKPVPAPAAAEKPMAAVSISKVPPPEQALEAPAKVPTKKIEISRVETVQMAPKPKSVARVISDPEVKVPEPIILSAQEAVPAPKVEMTKPEPAPIKVAEAKKMPKPVKIEPPQKAETISNINKISKVSRDVETSYSNVRSNNDALLEKTIISKKSDSDQPFVSQTSAQKEQREALERLKADNERLNKTLKAETDRSSVSASNSGAEVAALQSQINKLETDLMKAKSEPNAVDQKLQADLEKLKSENEQLKLNMQARVARAEQEKQKLAAEKAEAEQKMAEQRMAAEKAAAKKAMAEERMAAEKAANEKRMAEQRLTAQKKEAEAKREAQISKAASIDVETPKMVEPEVVKKAEVDPEVMRQLQNLKAENARLSNAVQGQEDKMAAFDASSPEAEEELAAMRKQLEILRNENIKLSKEAQLARGNMDTAVVETGNQAFKKIREYEKKYEAAQNDNLALSKEIEELRRMQEDGRLGAISGDWDLEKATKRYNEAEREIKRLGMLLEQQRVVHRQEKGELEQMLFDPAVTDQEQRRRLTELELQLAAAERELTTAGRNMPARPSTRPITPRPPASERVSVSGLTPEPSGQSQFVDQQRNNLEMQRLNNKIERQNQQLQAYNRAQEAERMAALPAATVRSQPLAQKPQPRAPEPIRQAVPQQPQAAPTPVQQSAAQFDQGNLQQLLNQAGVPLSGNVTRQAAGRYRWSAGNLTGQAQVISRSQAGDIDQFVQSYISSAKQSCGGDFASLPSANTGSMASYEIACISPSRSTSSSVVFVQKGNDLIAIAHESSADDMDAAMDARDRVASSL